MSKLYIVVDRPEIWAPYHSAEEVISSKDYLSRPEYRAAGAQVYNFCGDCGYRSQGYYCSLLAEARGQKVLPSVRTLNELSAGAAITLGDELLRRMRHYLRTSVAAGEANFRLRICFGQTPIAPLEKVAKKIFELYPAPLLEVTFERGTEWSIASLRLMPLTELDDAGQDEFAAALDGFSKKIWRQPRRERAARYDLAILVDPDEKLPPSNRGALQLFIKHARLLGIDADLITLDDEPRLLEYDALFIRQTTAINHPTLRFAQRAARNGMPVIDDPDSIIRCTNKVFLHELLTANKVQVPAARMLFGDEMPEFADLRDQLGLPLVLKIPDGSFSVGVEKVDTEAGYRAAAERLLRQSAVVIVQEFIATDFDWRVGVIAGRAIYACKYFMAKGHWQIYDHNATGTRAGGFETVAVHRVPAPVIRAALRATGLIGNGLYGVDLKETARGPVVIEVNDNPSIDRGVEDALLGEELYRTVMVEFERRLEDRAQQRPVP
ncbi:MAG TPA: RimK family protein [Porticoccaceae bacterium]|nr:RimK family protein [Porticoccaceae bacterium]